MSLPTFSELMASLQLTNKGEPETGVEDHPSAGETSPEPSPPSSPSTSFSSAAACQHPPSNHDSPSIVVSQFDSSRTTRAGEPRGQKSLGRSNRFAPYLGATPTTQLRRGSLSDVLAEMPERRDVPDRASSASPQMRSSALQDVSVNATRPQRPRKLQDINSESDVPISSFVRRHTPQSSPTASTFPHRRRSISSQNSFTPVILPTLLPGLTPSSPPHSTEDMEVSETEDLPPSHPQDSPKPRNRHQGLRVSSYRATSQALEDVAATSIRSAA